MASSIDQGVRPYTRAIWALVLVAALWSVGLLVAAWTFPAYSSDSESVVEGARTGGQTTTISHGTATLVQEDGIGVLIVVGLPLLASLVVAVALLRPRTGIVARVIAWVATCLLGPVILLGMLTVGPFLLPVALCLFLACVFDLARGAPRPSSAS